MLLSARLADLVNLGQYTLLGARLAARTSYRSVNFLLTNRVRNTNRNPSSSPSRTVGPAQTVLFSFGHIRIVLLISVVGATSIVWLIKPPDYSSSYAE